MAGALAFLQDYGGTLLVAGWAVVVLLLAALLVGMIRRRGSGSRATNRSPALTHETAPINATRLATLPEPTSSLPQVSMQAQRMFAILDDAALSAERAISAHAAAAKHLDSAEYQLQRLFDEFPMLDVSRARQPHAPPVSPSSAAPVPARALAA